MKFNYIDSDRPPLDIVFPVDFEQWVYDTIATHIIYDRFKREAHCIHCGRKWEYDIDEKIYSHTIEQCPYCQKEQLTIPHTSESRDYGVYFWMWNNGKEVDFAFVSAFWNYRKEPVKEIEETVINVYKECCGKISTDECATYLHWGKNHWSQNGSMYVDRSLQQNLHEHHAVQGVIDESFLKHCGISAHFNSSNSLIKEMAFFAKRPAAEYIRKAGLDELINNCIFGVPSYIRPNWKAKSIPGILRLSHQDVDKLKAWDMLNVDDIAIYHLIKKYKRKPAKDDLIAVRKSCFDMRDFKELMYPGTSPMKLIKYLQKQYDIEEQRRKAEKRTAKAMCHAGYYMQPPGVEYTVKREYGDYINLLAKLDYPIDDYYLYPKDLKAAHDAAAAEHNARMLEEQAKKNKKWNKEFASKILPELERFTYEDDKYIVRPIRTKEEFMLEGKQNHNCVASYAEEALAGKTKIFVLRKSETPNLSYVTIEISTDNKRLLQCYETGNRWPPDDVRKWAETWLNTTVKDRLAPSKRKASQKGGLQICQTA